MKVSFVRHGQTEGNISERHQTNTIELTQKGREQAQAAGTRLQALAPTHLITSPLTRATQTADIIATACALTPVTDELFAEVGRPHTFAGRHRKDLYSIWFYLRWFFAHKSAAQEGGETYKQLRTRIAQAQETLATYPKDAHIVVVSHAVFINFFLMHLCNKESLSFFQVLRCLRSILNLPNGAIITINYTPDSKGCAWQVEN